MSDRKAVLLLIAVCTGVLLVVFGEAFREPNAYMFGIVADGLKNYFTFAWYVKSDSGLHFSGMNHPWGEHIVYTDNQPLFSVSFGFIHRHLFPLDQYLIGIINCIIIGAIIAASVVIFFILRRCLLPAWYALPGSVLVILLATQYFVISQQYALTNLLVLPSVWLVIIRLYEQPGNTSRYVVYVLVLLAIGFIHPYFLPMGYLLYIGYWFWFIFWNRRNKAFTWRVSLGLLVAGITPLVLFKMILFFTDAVADRPETPGGFLDGKTTIAGLFFPMNSVPAALIEQITGNAVPPEQNYGYVGLAALICLFLAGLRAVRYLVKKDLYKVVRPVVPELLQGGLWAGILIVVFAAAIPFRFGLVHWLDYLPPLKQFRVLSRFTWMFYFIFSVYGLFLIYQIYRFLKIKNRRILAYSWLSVVLVIWITDALALLKEEVRLINKHKTVAEFIGKEVNVSDLLGSVNRHPADFQMILPIPYYSDGSEKIGYSNWDGTMYHSMKAAYQTGIPISTASMARTSITQVLLRTQLLSSDSIKKEILPLLHPTKPILVIVTDSAGKAYEKQLVAKSKFLARHKNVSYYELPISRLQQVYTEQNAAEKVTRLPANTVYNTFSENTSEKWLFNKGAMLSAEGKAIVFDAALPQAEANRNYQASVWLNARTMFGTPGIWLEEIDTENNVVKKIPYDLRDATEIYHDWLRATFYFKLNNAANRVRITMEGSNLIADELLIRPVNQPVYYFAEDQKKVIRNNYPVY